ncbi:MAG TPA: DUF427 domain-containing protein [Noviherbaspirillum sp.]|nr:DUF427 domain-containing protein [Noviherbaspirillum sp.]
MKAIWHGVVVAESDDVLFSEKDYYFPLASLKPQYLRLGRMQDAALGASGVMTFNLQFGRRKCTDAIWYFDSPKYAERGIFGRISFRKEVQIED